MFLVGIMFDLNLPKKYVDLTSDVK
jgi:hypothetical protein